MTLLYLLVPIAPLLGAIVACFFGRAIGRVNAHRVAITGVTVALLASLVILVDVLSGNTFNGAIYTWATIGTMRLEVGFLIDTLSATMMVVVTSVSLAVHIYTIGYMHDDPGYQRFFSYISLFTFSMLMLIMSNNFLQLFFGWEAVGLVSYLLIGFWYTRPTAIHANLKAFLVNRVGDFGFILGIGLVLAYAGTLDYAQVFTRAPDLAAKSISLIPGLEWPLLAVACICLFIGAMGKSAQFPLHVWLPDSMEGPTPISALIHAATMVTAGIFMVARMSPLFELSDIALTFVLIIGAITALFMGFLGIIQNDIKRVVAYSTLSQLGYMTVALGVSAYSVAFFHLMTHAFFKALLFLGSGSVIHGMHEEQDIRKMGGLKKYMPITYRTFLIGTLAIAGIPFFSGFFSKDEILWFAWLNGSPILWMVGALAAFTTAFYMWRLTSLTFLGEERFDHHHVHPHESPATMTIPLVVLAVLSALGGLLGVPHVIGHALHIPNLLEDWLRPIFATGTAMLPAHTGDHTSLEIGLMVGSSVLAVIGIMFARSIYSQGLTKATAMAEKMSGLYKLLLNKYYVDEVYHMLVAGPILAASRDFLWKIVDVIVIDGVVNGSAKSMGAAAGILRRMQSGVAQNYALVMMIGIVIMLAMVLMPMW